MKACYIFDFFMLFVFLTFSTQVDTLLVVVLVLVFRSGIGLVFRKPWGFPISGERSFRYKPYSHAGRSYEKYVVFINIFQEIRSQRTSLVPRLLTAANCLNQKNLSPCFCTLRALRVRPHSACTILAHTHRSSTATLDTLDATQCLLGFMVTEITTTCG